MSEIIFVYGLLILIYGFYIYKSKKPFIPGIKQKRSRRYYKYVGKTTMLLSCAPMISAFIFALNASLVNLIISIVVFIAWIIMSVIISRKCFKKWL